MNVYIVTKKMGGDGELGAAIITVSMLLSAVTLPMGIWVIKPWESYKSHTPSG